MHGLAKSGISGDCCRNGRNIFVVALASQKVFLRTGYPLWLCLAIGFQFQIHHGFPREAR